MTTALLSCVWVAALCLIWVSLIEGRFQTLCNIEQSREPCLLRAEQSSGAMGGWSKLDQNNADEYVNKIVSDVWKILNKKCAVSDTATMTTDLNEIYTQVVAGLNICMSVTLNLRQCEENQVMPCESQKKQCSILAYKPPSRGPVLASDVSIYCQ